MMDLETFFEKKIIKSREKMAKNMGRERKGFVEKNGSQVEKKRDYCSDLKGGGHTEKGAGRTEED